MNHVENYVSGTSQHGCALCPGESERMALTPTDNKRLRNSRPPPPRSGPPVPRSGPPVPRSGPLIFPPLGKCATRRRRSRNQLGRCAARRYTPKREESTFSLKSPFFTKFLPFWLFFINFTKFSSFHPKVDFGPKWLPKHQFYHWF